MRPTHHSGNEAARKPPILDFYHMLDCYLSLHRSEGYGLNLAEAASLGIPVIATGWGLADDIAAMPGVATVPWRLVPVEDLQGTYEGLAASWAEPTLRRRRRRCGGWRRNVRRDQKILGGVKPVRREWLLSDRAEMSSLRP